MTDISALAAKISGYAEDAIKRKFAEVVRLRRPAGQSVGEKRAYVSAHVEFMHYVERIKNAVQGGEHHSREVEPAHAH